MTISISMLAIDLAKGSFQVCAVGPEGTVLYNRSLSRTRLANHPTEVRIFEDGELIPCHPVLEGKDQKRVDPSHRNPVPPARSRRPDTIAHPVARHHHPATAPETARAATQEWRRQSPHG